MQQITLRVSNESIKFVRHLAGERRTAEAEVWRELIQKGIFRSNDVFSQLDRVTKLIVQSLCMSQRVAGHLDDNIIFKARNDARQLIARIAEAQEHEDKS